MFLWTASRIQVEFKQKLCVIFLFFFHLSCQTATGDLDPRCRSRCGTNSRNSRVKVVQTGRKSIVLLKTNTTNNVTANRRFNALHKCCYVVLSRIWMPWPASIFYLKLPLHKFLTQILYFFLSCIYLTQQIKNLQSTNLTFKLFYLQSDLKSKEKLTSIIRIMLNTGFNRLITGLIT